nr:immunoglobulin heavy chain junction region [Macaca mulatta]MOY22193.1 immunoglobulin heavy chain junction region [Macaca mulatta]MOY24100.1 immunoglobulin heavy chain junction region [Macaca mulatta]MOY25709.1 immunoglobulin heavy chain junction region [Macaca mulatta]MOY27123.1 immunoglobulin heavy chain junction region [Macaca mulatta]
CARISTIATSSWYFDLW